MNSWESLEKPKVSVVLCNFNYQNYVEAAINSVLSQTYPAFEIIVVDDGSTDQSVNIIRNNFPQVKLIQKVNEGQISAYNEGFKYVTGEVVVFLDSDDELLPDALAMISREYKQGVAKVQFKMRVIDKDGVDLNTVLPSHLDEGNCGSALVSAGVLYKSPPASGNSYRVEALKLLFPLPESSEEKHGADYFCIYGISLVGLIASLNQPLFKYRVHESGANIGSSLGFGNAVKKHDRQKVMQRRWRMLTEWLTIRLGHHYEFKPNFLDFTQQKFFFAQDIVNSNSLKERVFAIKKHLCWLSNSILVREDFSFFLKFGLFVWMFLVAISPKTIANRLAKIVCNPAGR